MGLRRTTARVNREGLLPDSYTDGWTINNTVALARASYCEVRLPVGRATYYYVAHAAVPLSIVTYTVDDAERSAILRDELRT